ncbi:MAG: hypothetical protein HQM10_02335 [Candidatus Riflebacteria bacterium]|nr:hypothetical protein [Candidatus Riflebacteria bacterium]
MKSLKIDKDWFSNGLEELIDRKHDSLRMIFLQNNLRHSAGKGFPFRVKKALLTLDESPHSHLEREFIPSEYAERMESAAIYYRYLLTAFKPGFCKIIRAFSKYEALYHLNPFNKHYRDHELHQLAVTIIADKFMTDVNGVFQPDKTSWADKISDDIRNKKIPLLHEFTLQKKFSDMYKLDWFTKNDARYTLGMAALLHDIGYLFKLPLTMHLDTAGDIFPFLDEKLSLVHSRIKNFLKDSLVCFWFTKQFKKFYGKEADFEEDVFPWFIAAIQNGNHGAVSCAFLLDHVHEWFSSGDMDTDNWLCLQWAALAILRHDLIDCKIFCDQTKNSPELWGTPFSEDPISFFLVLADNLHESCRHKLDTKITKNKSRTQIESIEPCCYVKISRNSNNLNVKFKFKPAEKKQSDHVKETCTRIFSPAPGPEGKKWRGWAPPAGFADSIIFI